MIAMRARLSDNEMPGVTESVLRRLRQFVNVQYEPGTLIVLLPGAGASVVSTSRPFVTVDIVAESGNDLPARMRALEELVHEPRAMRPMTVTWSVLTSIPVPLR